MAREAGAAAAVDAQEGDPRVGALKDAVAGGDFLGQFRIVKKGDFLIGEGVGNEGQTVGDGVAGVHAADEIPTELEDAGDLRFGDAGENDTEVATEVGTDPGVALEGAAEAFGFRVSPATPLSRRNVGELRESRPPTIAS